MLIPFTVTYVISALQYEQVSKNKDNNYFLEIGSHFGMAAILDAILNLIWQLFHTYNTYIYWML